MSLPSLERWYAAHCNGEWEHGYGIKIETLDNPGWRIQIDLRDTKKQGSTIERVGIDRNDNDWIQCWIEKGQFQIAWGH